MRPGDRLFLTKPLGIGIVTTAIKRGEATPRADTTRRRAHDHAEPGGGRGHGRGGGLGATDVTGFGLLGHLHIALEARGASRRARARQRSRCWEGRWTLAERGVVPGGTRATICSSAHTDWGSFPEAEQLVLADAQTSGGLLIAVPEDRAAALIDTLERQGVTGVEIGSVEAGDPGHIGIEGRLAR